MNRRLCKIVIAVSCCVTLEALSEEQSLPASRVLQSQDALNIAAEQNADLHSALLAERLAAANLEAAQGQYPFTLQMEGGYQHTSVPSVMGSGGIAHQARDSLILSGELTKTFSFGTTTGLKLGGNRQVSRGSGTGAYDTTVGGPYYNFSARFYLTQPILRGFGNRVGLADFRQASVDRDLKKRTRERTASELAKSVLETYWELWYAEQAVEFDILARDIARSQLEEAQTRVATGDVAPVDAFSFQTRLATLEETVVEAEAEQRRLAAELKNTLGITGEPGRIVSDSNEALPIRDSMPPLAQVTKLALANSPEIIEAETSLALAKEKAVNAGEAMRQRLDATGWVEAQTLGDDEISPVFTQLGDEPAYSGYVGLVWELPLSNQKKDAERAAAKLQVDIAAQNLRKVNEQVQRDVALAHDRLETARKRLELAEVTQTVAEKQAAAAREKHALGAAIFTEVRDAEESVREASLRMTRAKVDLVKYQVQLDHLTGTLLKTM
jgi:outer membrane protein TolC